MIGDRWRDIGAGKAAGCYTILIDHNYAEPLQNQPDLTCNNLLEAASTVLHNPQHVVDQRIRVQFGSASVSSNKSSVLND